ncbi:hypothetical protein J7F01_21215 [Streptomyces sp. ISL-22]|uniref:hypothetical protein n=1 Tax=unclassified Streptomyces TaxID=2593676 RepID=UPI001BE7E3BB|nr:MULTISPECIES: hypothetical protein [unclassified Streptomyces]MBT2417325.1 hypothetical protein [Streptomyces sp. ISL-24]MBT2434639.1 hypothetical protein [Streptomyces sp. ISL-22]
MREETDGYGADIYTDALGPGAPHETFLAGMRAMARASRSTSVPSPVTSQTCTGCWTSSCG